MPITRFKRVAQIEDLAGARRLGPLTPAQLTEVAHELDAETAAA